MIFCVEDEESIREIEIYTLTSMGYEAKGFQNGEELFAALKEERPQLILLDIMLPGEDGVEILRKLRRCRESASIPVIMATAKSSEFDKVESLDLGADDYLVKPFGMMEMVSRVRAVLRRTTPTEDGRKEELKSGPIVLSSSSRKVTVEGKEVILTLKEFELLMTLMSSPGIVFSREKLLSDIWGFSRYSETRTVDAHIKTLRQKLGVGGSLIETVRGVGYRIRDDHEA